MQEAEKAESINSVCEKHGISRATFYRWKRKYDAGESMSDKSQKRKKSRYSYDDEIEAEIVRRKKRNPKLSSREVNIKGLYGEFLSHMTVLKIWKKHGVKQRKVIPTKAIVEKLRKSVKSLTKEEDDLLKKRSVLYRQFGKDLEKGRGKTLMGVQCQVSDETSSVCNRASFAAQPYAHILIDCETLLVFVTVGNQVTVKKNASKLLKHVMRLMEKKNRKIETVLDSQNNYASSGVKAPRVSFSGNSQIGADLLKLLWTKDWMERIHTLYRGAHTQNVQGLWKYAKRHNRTRLKRYPLLGKSPLDAWRGLKR